MYVEHLKHVDVLKFNFALVSCTCDFNKIIKKLNRLPLFERLYFLIINKSTRKNTVL